MTKNYHIVRFLSVVSKVFEKLVNNRLVINSKNVVFCPISRMVSGLLDLLTDVSDRIARAFNRSGLLELYHLIYLRLLTRFGMLVFFTNLRLIEFLVRFRLISSFLINRQRFWMESLFKNIQLILVFFKVPLLALHFSYYTSILSCGYYP